MTSQDPDAIRADIERTRAALSDDVEALTDKVSPRRIVQRQTDRVRGAVSGAKDAVFGAAQDAAASTDAAASSAKERLADAPHEVAGKARGNPLAAGLVAFGLGLLAASLFPATRKERDLLESTRQSEPVQQLTETARVAATEVTDSLREPVRHAADRIARVASDGAADVRDAARSGADHVRDQTQDARDRVEDTARHAGG